MLRGRIGLQTEKGQAIVLIVFAIIVLLGFIALAVDGGQIYLSQRSAQAAADSAAMAAAFEASGGSGSSALAINKAYVKAADNGYNNDQVKNWVVVNNPPVGGAYCGVCGNPAAIEYYQVKITVKLSPIFAQFVYKGAEQVTVYATAHAKTSGALSQGDTLLSLSNVSDSMNFSGNTGVKVAGGNIRSNGGMIKNGASGDVIVNAPGKVFYSTTFSGHTSPFNPAKPQKGTRALLNSVPEPYCPSSADLSSWASGSGFKTKKINSVNYYYYPSGLSVENLPAGIHCINGGIGKGNYKGTDVLVVLLSGDIQQTGNDSVDFRSATNMIDKNGNQWGGMAFYAPSSNNSTFKFGGNSGAYFLGTIFAPGATCDIGGTEDGSAENAAFICNTIKFHGNPTLTINFVPSRHYQVPPSVDLVE